jgi:hypothetical protein
MRVMRMRHNKKRNTAFLYEALIAEIAKCIVNKDETRKLKVLGIVKEHFQKGRILNRELGLYMTLLESNSIEPAVTERVVSEVRRVYSGLNSQEVFSSQTKLIDDVNKNLSKSVYSNFVPNYKSIASISQLFDEDMPIKELVLLERKVIDSISLKEEVEADKIYHIDNVVFRNFVEKFNTAYSKPLLENQKELLVKYISSFSDSGIDFKIFLNEEIGQLKKKLIDSMDLKEMKADSEMSLKSKEVVDILEGFKNSEINRDSLLKILKIQNLVTEISS